MPNTAARPHQIGPYRIEAELRRSRSLIVYRAHDTLYERPVLLKVLPEEFAQNPLLVRRFISLGREAVRLHHPNLVEIYEAGHADGINYIAQELVAGGSLATRLQNRHHPYLIYDAIAIVEQLAAALDYAHQQGYAHGSLTADAILFTEEGKPKIADIGLLALDALGESGSYVANVSPYMAPEQARGESGVDRQADIYTLGVIAFLLLTGQTPFAADNPLALLRKIIDEIPPVDDIVVGAIPAHVSKTLRRVLAKSATNRHATATAFAQALLHGEPREAFAPEPPPATPTADESLSWERTVIEITPDAVAWQPAPSPVVRPAYVPLQEPVAAGAPRPDRPKRRYIRPLFTLSLLGTTALLLTLLTAGRLLWSAFGEQMVDVAMTPYAAAQASRLSPPLPPTMLTSADTPFFDEALARTTDLFTDQPLIVAMSSAGTGTEAGVAKLTGSPPMVMIAPSDTPTTVSTDTPSPSATPRPTATPVPTDTPVPTATSLPTATPTTEPSPTSTETTAPTASLTPSPTLSPTLSVTASPTSSPTPSPSPSPSPSPTATASPSVEPTATVSATPTSVPLAADLAGRIAYTRWDARVDRYNLIFYSIANGESWPIVPNRRQPDFGPGGKLVASGDGGYIDNLVLMGTNGENPVPISAHSEDSHPHWSASGKAVVFDSTLVGDGRHRLYLQTDERFGQSLTPMMFEAWEIFGRYPIFLSSGQIAYNGCDVWENASNCGIFRVDTAGDRPEEVTTWPGDIPTDNAGNQILAMSDRAGNWDIYRIDSATGSTQQLTDNPARDGLATLSPDGNYIAFVSDREGAWAIYTMRTDGSEQQKLFDLDGGFGSGDRDWIQERISWGS